MPALEDTDFGCKETWKCVNPRCSKELRGAKLGKAGTVARCELCGKFETIKNAERHRCRGFHISHDLQTQTPLRRSLTTRQIQTGGTTNSCPATPAEPATTVIYFNIRTAPRPLELKTTHTTQAAFR